MAVEEVEFKLGGGRQPPPKKEPPVDDDTVDVDEPDVLEDEGDDDVEIEVVDDTPEKDRGKKPAPPPDDVTDEELEHYSDKVKKRLKHFSRGFHDERRAKEDAARERDAAIALAKSLMDKVKTLEGGETKSKQMVIDQAKRAAELEHTVAAREYQDALDSGDNAAIAKAHGKVTAAAVRLDRVNNFKLPPVQKEKTDVQQPQQDPELQPKPAPVDPKAEKWRSENEWFGGDHEMTAFAIGYHRKLIESGVDPRSDAYYEKLNARMRQVFPEQFTDSDELDEDDFKPPAPKKPPPAVVAPATRSVAPKKIVLTKSEAEMARKLGVSLKDYALEAAKMRNKDNG